MKIYVCGCSFTYGDELENPQADAWPVILANMLNATVNNDAMNGGSNTRTVYRTIKSLKDNYDYYLVAWTTYSRFTFYNTQTNFEVNFNVRLKHDLLQSKSFYTAWGRTLYKHWYNELFAVKLWLQQIIQLQKVLDTQNYIMINTSSNNLSSWLTGIDNFIQSIKELINYDIMNDDQILDEYKEIQYYLSLIDVSKFYRWNDFYIQQLCSEFECGPGGHILNEGHQHLAKLLYQHICLK
jgi:hypothetical protein